MIIRYARTSSFNQKAAFDAQLAELASMGVEKVFSEQVSDVGLRKPLDEALEFARKGDVLVVSKLDRLARSVMHLSQIVETLLAQGGKKRLGLNTSRYSSLNLSRTVLLIFPCAASVKFFGEHFSRFPDALRSPFT